MQSNLRFPASRRPGLRGWPAVVGIGFSFAVTMMGTTLPTPLYPLYRASYGFGELATTVVYAVYVVGVLVALLLFGHWSDQIGRIRMLRAGVLLSALSTSVFLLGEGTGWLLVGRLVSGLSAGIFTGTASAAMVEVAPPGGAARATLAAAAVNIGGLGAGPLVAGALAEYAPWPLRLCFVVESVLTVIGLVAVSAVAEPVRLPSTPTLRPQKVSVPGSVRTVFIKAAIPGFAGFAVLGLFAAVAPSFLAVVLHTTNHAATGLVVALLFLASVTGQLSSSGLGEYRSLLLGCAALIAGMTLVATGLLTASLAFLTVGGAAAGVGQGLAFRAGLDSIVRQAQPKTRGSVTSAFFVVLYAGITLPVIGEGALANLLGLVQAGTLFNGFVIFLGVTALLFLARRRREPLAR
ncbi:MFS transporter [Streptomyces sp. GS7]|uniref:MFS transporter n=1 Tax=Streptomyces sp. GS7 TaxID=2692234 RepID=UPI001F1FAC00|nr:MFS transporter [Streptomyces sp. GS7]